MTAVEAPHDARDVAARASTSSFIVERYLPGASHDQLHDIVDRLARSTFDAPTRYLGSIVVPGDESILCLFDAVDAETVRSANEALGFPLARVTEAELSLDPDAD